MENTMSENIINVPQNLHVDTLMHEIADQVISHGEREGRGILSLS